MALGGGGSTYLTDYNANFYNPANLVITDRKRDTHVGLMVSGIYFNGLQNFNNLDQQRTNIEQYFNAYDPAGYQIDVSEKSEILSDNFIKDRLISHHQSRVDVTLIGLKWQRNDRAYSFAIRNRIASSFDIGRGWYSGELAQVNNTSILDRTLNHRYQSLYEISLGYAEDFEFFSAMTPRLDQFSIGIAPKFILSGAYQDARYTNSYLQNESGTQHIREINIEASGNYGKSYKEYLEGRNVDQTLVSTMTNEILNPIGFGGGLDIGITYLVTLGDDLSTLEGVESQTKKSIRFSASITDIGFIMYGYNGFSLSSDRDTVSVNSVPANNVNKAFVGAPGQFLGFADEFGLYFDTQYLSNAERADEPVTVLLPTAFNAGVMLELNRLKLMGDLSVGLRNSAFNSTALVASVGVELRPLPFLPLRAGTQLATERPAFFSFGTALETKLLDISVATQFVARNFDQNPKLSGVTVAALQFHF